MGIYQVIKNNGKRAVRNKTNVILVIAVPLVIWMIAMISLQVKNKSIRVGIVPEPATSKEEMEQVKNELSMYDGIDVGIVNPTYAKTDQIMGKYHQYLYMGEDTKGEIEKITAGLVASEGKGDGQGSESKQVVALLCTVFLVFATVHGSNYIKDKKQGVVERYRMAGQTLSSYSVGYAIYTFGMIVVQSSICFGLLCLGVPAMDIQVGQFLIIILGLSVITTGISTVLIHITKNEMQANLLSSGIALICMLLSGTFVSIESMPGWIQGIVVCNPFGWILNLI